MSNTRTNLIGTTIAAIALAAALPSIGHADTPPPPATEASASSAGWLETVNFYRAQSGLPPVTEDPAMSDSARLHACYLVQNDTITHHEEPGKPGYTEAGAAAGEHSNVAVSSALNASARSHVDVWMAGPFHANGILRRELTTVGFGSCSSATATTWKSGAALNVLGGLGAPTVALDPVLFPGDGAVTALTSLVNEQPDPGAACGWPSPPSGKPYGLPVFAMMPEAPTGTVTTSLVGPDGPVQVCTLSELNTTGTAQQLLTYDHAVVAVPRTALTAGRYTATASSSSRTVTWAFTVDPGAANRPLDQVAAQSRPSAGFQAVVPTRLVDTRDDDGPAFGATRLTGGVPKQIQITGGVVPTGATAASANFTVVDAAGTGYLTVWDCAGDPPVVSTVNFAAGEIAPNAASIALSQRGQWCVFSNVDTDLVIDVNGYYGLSARSRFTPVTPSRLLDTRTSERVAGGSTRRLRVTGVSGVPVGTQAVALNVTSDNVGGRGVVTVFPCDASRPTASNLNPVPGRTRPNLVITPVAADGTVCFFSQSPLDLIVDVTGYFSTTSTARFVSNTPFRLLDTRTTTMMGAGENRRIHVTGVRDVPAGATAVSLNVTVTGATGRGFLQVFPCGEQPDASTANYDGDPRVAVSNGAQLPLSVTGDICLFTNTPVQVVIDVNGWWS